MSGITKVGVAKTVVKGYFAAAMVGSFTHIIHAAHRTGLEGWEAGITPFLIDGMFIIAMVMRADEFSARTRRIGFRLQVVMGAMSLTANCYAATRLGGYVLAGLLVGGMVFGEWLVGQIESAEAEQARIAAEAVTAEAERIAAEAAEKREIENAKRRAARAAKKATQARTARQRKAEEKVLEKMIQA
jgi:hypothetical protein